MQNPMIYVLIGGIQGTFAREKRERQCYQGGRDWAACCHKPRKAWSHQEQEEKTESSPNSLEDMWPCHTLILDFWLPDQCNNSCCPKGKKKKPKTVENIKLNSENLRAMIIR